MDTPGNIILQTDLPLPLFIRGKVRDTYDLGTHLLIVTTDRISAFDVILPEGIPDKGRVLNQMSAFWMEKTRDITLNHFVLTVGSPRDLSPYIGADKAAEMPNYIAGRSMVVKKARRIPVECVVRGYLAGGGWSEYRQDGSVSGVGLPKGLVESEKLPEPIFTPSTKADTGHDAPMTIDEVSRMIGSDLSGQIRAISVELYNFAAGYAINRGFIIADTKFEFGLDGDNLIVIDEMLTPDSSRFWDINTYREGVAQDSFDKQPVRDWLSGSGWNKLPPAPGLPPDIVAKASRRYRQAYEKLTGQKLA